jgi:hypothetical protein
MGIYSVMRPLALSDRQIIMLKRATAILPEEARRQFVADVAEHLGASPSNNALTRAINIELARRPPRNMLHAQSNMQPGKEGAIEQISEFRKFQGAKL